MHAYVPILPLFLAHTSAHIQDDDKGFSPFSNPATHAFVATSDIVTAMA